MHGVLARAGGVGAMGQIGHIAIVFKLLAYNTVYRYCIQFTLLSIYTTHNPNDPKPSFPLWARIGQPRRNHYPTHNPIDPTKIQLDAQLQSDVKLHPHQLLRIT